MRTGRPPTAAVTCGLLATAGLAMAVGGTEAQQPGPPTGTLQLVLRQSDGDFRLTVDAPPRRRGNRVTNGDGFQVTGAVRDQAGMESSSARDQATQAIVALGRSASVDYSVKIGKFGGC